MSLPPEVIEHVKVLREWMQPGGRMDKGMAAVEALVAMLPPEFSDEEVGRLHAFERDWLRAQGGGETDIDVTREWLTDLAVAGGRVVWDDQ